MNDEIVENEMNRNECHKWDCLCGAGEFKCQKFIRYAAIYSQINDETHIWNESFILM